MDSETALSSEERTEEYLIFAVDFLEFFFVFFGFFVFFFRLWPNYASAMNNLGTVLLARADQQLSEEHHGRNDSSHSPDHAGVLTEAKKYFYDAIRSHPHHVHAHYNLAVLHW